MQNQSTSLSHSGSHSSQRTSFTARFSLAGQAVIIPQNHHEKAELFPATLFITNRAEKFAIAHRFFTLASRANYRSKTPLFAATETFRPCCVFIPHFASCGRPQKSVTTFGKSIFSFESATYPKNTQQPRTPIRETSLRSDASSGIRRAGALVNKRNLVL
jgi:hypothetical protein